MDIAATALRSGYNYLASQAAVLETAALLLSMKLFRSWETIFTIIGPSRIDVNTFSAPQ